MRGHIVFLVLVLTLEIMLVTGKVQKFDLQGQWSTAIVKELMEVAGGEPWIKWKRNAQREKIPIIPGEDKEKLASKRVATLEPLPTLREYKISVKQKGKAPPKVQLPPEKQEGIAAALP